MNCDRKPPFNGQLHLLKIKTIIRYYLLENGVIKIKIKERDRFHYYYYDDIIVIIHVAGNTEPYRRITIFLYCCHDCIIHYSTFTSCSTR